MCVCVCVCVCVCDMGSFPQGSHAKTHQVLWANRFLILGMVKMITLEQSGTVTKSQVPSPWQGQYNTNSLYRPLLEHGLLTSNSKEMIINL